MEAAYVRLDCQTDAAPVSEDSAQHETLLDFEMCVGSRVRGERTGQRGHGGVGAVKCLGVSKGDLVVEYGWRPRCLRVESCVDARS